MNRVRHITVTLDCDLGQDDADAVMDAIRQLRRVAAVTPVLISPLEQIRRRPTNPSPRRKTL